MTRLSWRMVLMVAVLSVGCTFPRAIHAQHTLRGVVRDPVVRGGPLAGAEVVVLNTALIAITDDSGRYELGGVPAGKHVLMVSHPVLDTLALPPLEEEVDLTGDGVVDFTTPSLGAYQLARCGRELAAHESILLGFASGADDGPATGARITARWFERTVRRGNSEQASREAAATADAEGAFAVCGVPREPALSRDSSGVVTIRSTASLSASSAAGEATGALAMLAIHPAVVRRDLRLGRERPVAAVTGRILAADGRPLRGARVSRTGGDSLGAVSDSLGQFTLAAVPRRMEQVVIRAVGHQPVSVEFTPDDDRFDLGDIPLEPFVFTLGTVEVRALRSRERAEFEERRAMGLGTFLDDEEIKRLPKMTPQVLAARVARADPVRDPLSGKTIFALKRVTLTETRCVPPMFVDGVKHDPPFEPGEQDQYLSMAVRVEVYTAQFAPPRFTDFNGCGAVVIWTR